MENISDILKSRMVETIKVSKLQKWQLWALDFCKQYAIEKRDYGRVMKIAKEYEDKLDYLSYIKGWLSDYPNLSNGKHALKMLFWKVSSDRKASEVKKKVDNREYM